MKQTRFNIYIILFSVIIMSSCKKENPPAEPSLKLRTSHKINVQEASGLALYKDGFLTVSDSLGKIYLLDSTGIVTDSLAYEGDDLEGVTVSTANSGIFVIEENTDEVVSLDSTGLETGRFKVDYARQFAKHGIEGITMNTENGHLFVVSEKWPSILFEISLDGQVIETHNLSFAQDYSSIFYEPINKNLWILSDESKSLTKCTLAGNPIKTYKTGIDKGEGVVVDILNAKVYIVTDAESSLYTFTF
ncbi:MAG: SdiA-regulated domain-containing protein [Bacteroidales bacterium]|nr:SdiA-regulated domain-containing protein [Bacteroidales bacterium]MCF8405266.1 SdiA-regulated domain-containing protein [Bacteroidales bacterium]